jgi:hypothetical protein
VTDTPIDHDENGPLSRARFEALGAEVSRLRAEVARLRRENDALVRKALDREYERPPHYQ